MNKKQEERNYVTFKDKRINNYFNDKVLSSDCMWFSIGLS